MTRNRILAAVAVGSVYDDVSGDAVVGATLAFRLADPVAFTAGAGGNGDLASVGVGMRVYR